MSWKSHSGDRKAIGTSVDQGIASNVIMTIISAHNAMLEPQGLEIQKYGQNQIKAKTFQIARFCHKNLSDKTRQIRVKSVLVNFKHKHVPNMLHRVHL